MKAANITESLLSGNFYVLIFLQLHKFMVVVNIVIFVNVVFMF
jgi:hypothetical protein